MEDRSSQVQLEFWIIYSNEMMYHIHLEQLYRLIQDENMTKR